jgi:hypothetical protein
MKVLPAGTPKYLFIIPEEVERNFERKTSGGPVAMVGEPDSTFGMIYHSGYGVLAEGPVVLEYRQVGEIAKTRDQYTGRDMTHRAVYMTADRVAIAETREEAETLMLPSTISVPDLNTEPDLRPLLDAAIADEPGVGAKPTKKEKAVSGKAE